MVSDILSERQQRRKDKAAAVQAAMANALAEKRYQSDQEYRSHLMDQGNKPEIREVNGALYRVWPNEPNKKPELVVQAPDKPQNFQQASQGEDLYTFNPSTGNFELKIKGKGKSGKVTAKYITPEGIELSGDYESLKPYVTGPSAQKPGDLNFPQEQRKKVVDLNNQISKEDPENLGMQVSPERVDKQIQYIVSGDSSSAPRNTQIQQTPEFVFKEDVDDWVAMHPENKNWLTTETYKRMPIRNK